MEQITITGRCATNGSKIYNNASNVSIGIRNDEKTNWQRCRGVDELAIQVNRLNQHDIVVATGTIITEYERNRSTGNVYPVNILVLTALELVLPRKKLVLKSYSEFY